MKKEKDEILGIVDVRQPLHPPPHLLLNSLVYDDKDIAGARSEQL